ncbi:DNA cytosine methyltransferase, partial [Mycobacterium tuberculosis]|nr:DNA cytosine methyltransferase [Mycobacterium tuberculosis]
RERARLQSFPDDFIFHGAYAEVRRQIGNAVPPLGVEVLARRLMSLFAGDFERTDLGAEIARLQELTIAQRLAEANQEAD